MNEDPFFISIKTGKLDKVTTALRHRTTHPTDRFNILDIHDYQQAFFIACYSGYTEIAKWLLDFKPMIDICFNNHSAFRHACCENKVETAEWLVSLKPDIYNIDIMDNQVCYTIIERSRTNRMTVKDANTKIEHTRPSFTEKPKNELCTICYAKNCEIETKCSHSYCKECIEKWMEKQNTCPNCRSFI
jgi:hypothetical protein